MAGGHVDRGVLSSNYQDPGQNYDDKKTEGAFEIVAQQVDSNWDDYKVLKDKLASIAIGDSGAHNVGSTPIPGVGGSSVYAQIIDLLAKIQSIQNGVVPSGSVTNSMLTGGITEDKLAFNPVIQNDYEYQTPSIVGTQIQLQKVSDTSRLYFKLAADLTGAIAISLDGGATSKTLKDVAGVDVTSLEKGYVEVIADATFFTLKPSGGGLWLNDWSAYQTVYDWTGTAVSTPANSWRSVLDTSGEGYLHFLRGFADSSGADNPDIRLTVDGNPYVFQGSTVSTAASGNLLTHPIYFKKTLKIELFNRHATVAFNMGCDYVYLLKTSSPKSSKQTILQASNRREALNSTTTTTLTDVVNITGAGYLLGFELSNFTSTSPAAADTMNASVIIDGVTKMNDRLLVKPTGGTGYKQHFFNGPIRFNTALRVQHRTSNAANTVITRVFYTLD